ncbi:prephenate dehydrogenase/arogenate dehydrogenase family protein [Methylobacterium sp. P31]
MRAGGRYRGSGGRNDAASQARRHRVGCRLGEGRGGGGDPAEPARGIALVPGHPIAGTEFSGPDAGFATLFHGRWCILTPPEGTDPAAVDRVRALWEGMGANVETMRTEHHDHVLAITSHLPHLIAYNIVGTAADLESATQSR